jgi:hypothetical protein
MSSEVAFSCVGPGASSAEVRVAGTVDWGLRRLTHGRAAQLVWQ